MKNKIIFLIVLMYFISSCSGFGVKRSDKADEFLIEKKAPLVMPPDIEDLPEPQGIDKKNLIQGTIILNQMTASYNIFFKNVILITK